MTIFTIDFGIFTVNIAKPTKEKAIEEAKENFPTRKIVDVYEIGETGWGGGNKIISSI